MRVVILSTETKHHAYFINSLAKDFDISGVVYEECGLKKSYPTESFFKKEKDEFEERFFSLLNGSVDRSLGGNLKERVYRVGDINSPDSVSFINECRPDVMITFGVKMGAVFL